MDEAGHPRYFEGDYAAVVSYICSKSVFEYGLRWAGRQKRIPVLMELLKSKLLWNVVCLRNTSHLDLSWAPSQKRIPVLMELLFLKLLWNAVCLKIHLH